MNGYTRHGNLHGMYAADPVPRSLSANQLDWINVKDFGAVGDGSANDTVALQRALDKATRITSATATWGGVGLLIPPGHYMANGLTCVNLPGLHIMGSGRYNTILECNSNGGILLTLGQTTNLNQMWTSISNLTLSGGSTASSNRNNTLLKLIRTPWVTLSNVSFRGNPALTSHGNGISTGHGLHLLGVWDCTAYFCHFEELGDATHYPLYVELDGAQVADNCNNWYFFGCRWEHNDGTDVYMSTDSTYYTEAFRFVCCKWESTSHIGTRLAAYLQGNYLDFLDCTFANYRRIIQVTADAGDTSNFVRIMNCQTHSTGVTFLANDVLFNLDRCNDCIIEGNRITGGFTALPPAGTAYISLGANATRTRIGPNNYLDTWQPPASYISDSGTGTVVYRNTGYVTENSGTATIASGATLVNVTHGLSYTPAAADIVVVATNNPTNDPGHIWVDTITSTQFRINCRADPGASGLNLSWSVQK